MIMATCLGLCLTVHARTACQLLSQGSIFPWTRRTKYISE
jgi:hypothetical protein